MDLAAEGRLPRPLATSSRLLSMPLEIRIQIYYEVFRGLEYQLFHSSEIEMPRKYSTLATICGVCRIFLVEARTLFLRAVTFFTHADVSLCMKLDRLSAEDYHSIRKVTVFVTRQSSRDYSRLPDFLSNIELLNICLTPWCPAYLDIEAAMKSKDTIVITDSEAEYDEERRIGVNRLFANFEDWVRDLAINHASGNSLHKFKLLVWLDFINMPDDEGPKTTVGCEIDVLSRISTIHIPGCKSGILKLPVLIGKGLHPNAICEGPI